MEVQNIPINDGSKQFDVVDKGDVVVLPAFGSTVEEMMTLSDKKVQIVDTTCPWLSKSLRYDIPIVYEGKYISMKTMAEVEPQDNTGLKKCDQPARSATGIEGAVPSGFVPARLPTFHSSAQGPWNAMIAYDAFVWLCLHAWAKQ
ncbi:hypothetical protein C3L33_22273, partial [Rhododendron williamsianum]